MCCLGAAFPKIHDLDELAALLDDVGQGIPPRFAPLLEFTDFAVAFRYDAFPDLEAGVDRQECTAAVLDLIEHVRGILVQETP